MPMIRALGPGSVSSFLKAILDVFYVFLWLIGALLAVLIFGLLLVSFDPQILPPVVLAPLRSSSGSLASAAVSLAAGELQVVTVLVLIQRLRKIFATMTAGDPFHPENVRRLRVVGLCLALLEISRSVFAGVHWFVLHEPAPAADNLNLTAWFAVLVVFVLAEVFREGARLRRDAELTI